MKSNKRTTRLAQREISDHCCCCNNTFSPSLLPQAHLGHVRGLMSNCLACSARLGVPFLNKNKRAPPSSCAQHALPVEGKKLEAAHRRRKSWWLWAAGGAPRPGCQVTPDHSQTRGNADPTRRGLCVYSDILSAGLACQCLHLAFKGQST